MHYRNGRVANNGDKVIQFDFDSGKIVSFGVLYGAKPGNDYCNGSIAPIMEHTSACLCDCLHVDDLQEIIKEKCLDKRQESKG